MSNKVFTILHDMVESNGKTIKENNLAIKHKIPIGSLVEVKFDEWFGDGACWKVQARLFVDAHTRDCDGTPLYTLRSSYQRFYGFGEQGLKPIEVTTEISRGEDALEGGLTNEQ